MNSVQMFRLRIRSPRRLLYTFVVLVLGMGMSTSLSYASSPYSSAISPSTHSISSTAFPLALDPLIEQAKLQSADSLNGDALGSAVAISGDGSTIVVGAPVAKIGDNGENGAAYIYIKPAGGSWHTTLVFAAKLTPSDGIVGGGFGSTVDISNDGNTVVVGMSGGGLIGNNGRIGKAYVFEKPAGGWATMNETATLTNTNQAAADGFGLSVSITDDGETVAVGAAFVQVENNGQQGAIYVFAKPEDGWESMTETAMLTLSDGQANDYFGVPAVISNDGSTIVGLAPLRSAGGIGSIGTANVFVRPGNEWASTSTYSAQLTPSDGTPSLHFGIAVSANTDGAVIVVGSINSDIPISDTQAQQGAAYVFVRETTWITMTESAKLIASDRANGDGFGFSTAISGDGNTILIGANNAHRVEVENQTQGAAYLFAKQGSNWVSTEEFDTKLLASDQSFANGVGTSVSLSTDAALVVVGSPLASGPSGNQGAAYVWGPVPPLYFPLIRP